MDSSLQDGLRFQPGRGIFVRPLPLQAIILIHTNYT